ncbi:MAG: DUF2188 domain-containing protein [Bauldia sp.]
MTRIKYEVVEHDGGFAYKLGDVFSEPFPTHDEALAAARRAAIEQRMSGETAAISWQDAAGRWHEELSRGDDRPETAVVDETAKGRR